MRTVLQTAGSESDLLEIGRYIARESQSLDVALSFLDKIEQKCLLYASQPLMGTPRFDLGDNVHSFSVDKYVVFYQPLTDGIRVLLVVHGSRNLPPILKERLGEPNR
jgi:toxin ParE1/3/4